LRTTGKSWLKNGKRKKKRGGRTGMGGEENPKLGKRNLGNGRKVE